MYGCTTSGRSDDEAAAREAERARVLSWANGSCSEDLDAGGEAFGDEDISGGNRGDFDVDALSPVVEEVSDVSDMVTAMDVNENDENAETSETSEKPLAERLAARRWRRSGSDAVILSVSP